MRNRIKELRTKHLKQRDGKKYTQKQFASRIGLSENFIWQIENGEREPSERTISDICREFGCSDVWLRTGKGDPFEKEDRTTQIMRFASEVCTGSDEFKKSFVAMLAKMNAEDWERLTTLFQTISDGMKKE